MEHVDAEHLNILNGHPIVETSSWIYLTITGSQQSIFDNGSDGCDGNSSRYAISCISWSMEPNGLECNSFSMAAFSRVLFGDNGPHKMMLSESKELDPALCRRESA